MTFISYDSELGGNVIFNLSAPITGDNGKSEVIINQGGVKRLVVKLIGSGAITQLCYTKILGTDLVHLLNEANTKQIFLHSGSSVINGSKFIGSQASATNFVDIGLVMPNGGKFTQIVLSALGTGQFAGGTTATLWIKKVGQAPSETNLTCLLPGDNDERCIGLNHVYFEPCDIIAVKIIPGIAMKSTKKKASKNLKVAVTLSYLA